MHSALYGMVEKARRYADEPDRIQIEGLRASVRGDSGPHAVVLRDGRLSCDCDHFGHEGLCAHVLTVERVLKRHLPEHAAPYPGAEGAG